MQIFCFCYAVWRYSICHICTTSSVAIAANILIFVVSKLAHDCSSNLLGLRWILLGAWRDTLISIVIVIGVVVIAFGVIIVDGVVLQVCNGGCRRLVTSTVMWDQVNQAFLWAVAHEIRCSPEEELVDVVAWHYAGMAWMACLHQCVIVLRSLSKSCLIRHRTHTYHSVR